MKENRIVQAAQQALLYEVVCFPKPGLVDPVDNGSHPDMDIFDFIDSSVALLPYLNAFFEHGNQFKTQAPHLRLRDIRSIGIQAEQAMLEATDQVNTHKGAIFSLGIFLNSLGALLAANEVVTLELLQQDICKMTQELLNDFDQIQDKPENALSFGELLFKKYGLLGIRGQAYSGYPEIFKYGLPFFQQHEGNRQEQLLDTLLHLALYLEDTTLIKRSQNAMIQMEIKPMIAQYFELGASQSREGKAYLNYLNVLFKRKNWSLGGCADMLILVVFLAKLIEKGILES